MIVRRMAALALAASLLHLNVVRADAACGKHEQTDAAARETAPHHSMLHEHGMTFTATHDAGLHAPAVQESPCETPTQPECCQALTSCSSAFSIDAPATSAAAPSSDAAVAAISEMPQSRAAAPEPPPPKA